jgi:protein phosphatase 2C family protein 2/3
MTAYFVSLKGKRESNEDYHNIIVGMNKDKSSDIANVNYFGIYDGHGGKFVSKFLSENIPKVFTHKDVKYPLDVTYVRKECDNIQNILSTKYKNITHECGSTCLIVCQFEQDSKKYLNIVNIGDSRCVMCRNNMAMALTKDHKPNWPDEKHRIMKLGGKLHDEKNRDVKLAGSIHFDGYDWRIDSLSVSRSFGDGDCKKYVSHQPDIYKFKITDKDKFIIIGCDGLWDVVSNHDAVNFVLERCFDINKNHINKKINIARKLAEYALQLGSTDNITIIIVFFD